MTIGDEMSLLPIHNELSVATRLRGLTTRDDTATLRDWLSLVAAGVVAAAASMLMDFHLRVPGHAILRAAIPVALGLALVPRHGAGIIMGGVAFAGAMTIGLTGMSGGGGLSLGAITSLTAIGPLLDWSLRKCHGGWRIYTRFAIAGLAANALAFAVRGGAKLSGLGHAGGKPFAVWAPTAGLTYTLCGLAAGLLCGVVLFDRRNSNNRDHRESA